MKGDKITADYPYGCGGAITLEEDQARAIRPKCGQSVYIQPGQQEPSVPDEFWTSPETRAEEKVTGEEPEEPEPETEEPEEVEKTPESVKEKPREENYTCSVCNKTFDKETSVQMHSLRSHKDANAWKSS